MAKRDGLKRRSRPGKQKAAVALRKTVFVEAYITNGGNATQAAITAGYSEKTCEQIGHQLLKKTSVQIYLAVAHQKIEQRTGGTQHHPGTDFRSGQAVPRRWSAEERA